MTLALLVFVAIVAIVLIGKLRARAADGEAGGSSKSAPQSAAPLKPRKLWNASELSMYQRLCEALPDHIFLAEVGYQAFISAGSNRSLQGEIKSRRIDFLILDLSGATIAAIELDGSSHDNDRSAATDRRKSELLAGAGIKLIRWRAELLPKGPEIVAAVLGGSSPAKS